MTGIQTIILWFVGLVAIGWYGFFEIDHAYASSPIKDRGMRWHLLMGYLLASLLVVFVVAGR